MHVSLRGVQPATAARRKDLSAAEADATARWRRAILKVAVEEMGHLTAVWNITAALGGSPRFGRMNFPLDPGGLPANVIVRLAPFSEAVLQHFIYLERPTNSAEPDGAGFTADFKFTRGDARPRVTPMPIDYETVGAFYETLSQQSARVRRARGREGGILRRPQPAALAQGDRLPGLRSGDLLDHRAQGVRCHREPGRRCGARRTRTRTTAASSRSAKSCSALRAKNPQFQPAFPAAVNPVLRRPVRAGARVWLENEETAATVDLANTAYMLMLRLISHSYLVPRPHPAKALCVDLALGLMRAMSPLAERAARLPAGPSNPDCNAGMSFTALRDAAPLPPGVSAGRFFLERLRELLGRRAGARGEWRCARGAGAEDAHRAAAARRAQLRRTSNGIRRWC